MRNKTIWILIVLSSLALTVGLYLFPFDKGPSHGFDYTFGAGKLNGPVGIAINAGRVYVADTENHRIQVFDLEGNYLNSIGKEGSRPGEFNTPMHLTIGPDGNLYVPEFLNDRIQVLSPNGESLYMIGESGSGPGQFDAPASVAVDMSGNLYVADFYNQRIQKLSKDGDFLRQWGVTGEKVFSVVANSIIQRMLRF